MAQTPSPTSTAAPGTPKGRVISSDRGVGELGNNDGKPADRAAAAPASSSSGGSGQTSATKSHGTTTRMRGKRAGDDLSAEKPSTGAPPSTSRPQSTLIGSSGDDVDFTGQGGTVWSERSFLYQFMPFRGMYYDVKRRLPFYLSDWYLGFKPQNFYRVVASSIKIYFINLLPAIAYILDTNHRTNGNYGINEALFTSAIPLIVFPLFSVQPLTIVGYTGLTNLVAYTTYDIIEPYGVDYLQFMAWLFIWAAIFHWMFAVFNVSDYVRFITDMTSETFGFYVGIVYIQKGIELLILEFPYSATGGWLSVTVAILFSFTVYFVQKAGGLAFGPLWLRKIMQDYTFALAAVFWSGFVHIPGYIKDARLEFLPITKSFYPTLNRSWLIRFWDLPVKWIFVALPFGFLTMLLFYFDHNVSSLMAQARQYPVKRPAGFHWDFFLLGITTFISGILGLPAPNGLVPQAPVNSESLSVLNRIDHEYKDTEGIVPMEDYHTWKERTQKDRSRMEHKVVRTALVEQRVSHFAIGLLTVGTMTRPLLVCLGLMPRALFAGVFLVVGWGSIEGNGITHKTLFLLRDPKMTPREHILLTIPRRKTFLFVLIQWLFFAMTFGISQTKGAIGFPVIITALIPLRYYFGPKWFSPVELAILDAPTANSPAVMVSIGSDLARVTGEGLEVAPDTGIAGTKLKERVASEEAADDEQMMQRLRMWRIRSREEDDDAHIQSLTSIRR